MKIINAIKKRLARFFTRHLPTAEKIVVNYCIVFTFLFFMTCAVAQVSIFGYKLMHTFERMTAPFTYAAPITPKIEKQPVPPVALIDTTRPPILAKIAKAESGDKQFDSKGNVVTHVNADGSVDCGKYQINLASHLEQAKRLGYDLFTEAGNESYAIYLLKNYGTLPWKSSQAKWSKM